MFAEQNLIDDDMQLFDENRPDDHNIDGENESSYGAGFTDSEFLPSKQSLLSREGYIMREISCLKTWC